MKVEELLDNDEFSFNCMYRLVQFSPTNTDPLHVTVLHESGKGEPVPDCVMSMFIGDINQNLKTGIVDIECY